MALFSSRRERNLWLWAATVLVAIYSTLGLAGALAAHLRQRELLDSTFFLAFIVLIAVVVRVSLRRKPGAREIWAAIGVAAVYGMAFMRMSIPEERTHLVEYGLLAVLIYQALLERRSNGRAVWWPALLTIGVTALLGWVDEGIQWLLPERVYDWRDVGVNALSGLMAVTGSAVMARARGRLAGKGSP